MPKKNTPHARPLRDDSDRREQFIELLRTGTVGPVEAARRASPHLADSSNPQAGYSAFRKLREVDPRFAAEWDAALEEGKAKLLAQLQELALRWVVEPAQRPVFSKGELVGHYEDRNAAVKVLLRMLAKLDPEWAERRQTEHKGRVEHAHAHLHGSIQSGFVVTGEVLDLLPTDRQELLLGLMQEIHEAQQRKETEHVGLPGTTDS